MVHANGWQSPFQGENLRVRIPSPSPTLKEKKMSECCQCKSEDHTVDICIGQIQEHQKEADKYFKILSDDCDYHVDCFCQIPLEVYSETGVIMCVIEKCPLVKEK